MIRNQIIAFTPVAWLKGLTHRSAELQMMPMPMVWDMWAWFLLLATILIAGIALAVYLSTRPRQIAQSPAPPPTPPTPQPSHIVENPQTATITELAEPAVKTTQLKKALELVRPTINNDERRVLNEIVKANGEILQSDLPERTDFSKATISKLIKSLENMGIVTREKHKWTYWVRISEKLISRTKNA